MHNSYVKALFSECWDTWQLRMVEVGGNKRFFEFLKEYNKEREPINKKYVSSAAQYYKRVLSLNATGKPVTERAPPRNAEEFAKRTTEDTAKFFSEANEKYEISQKAAVVGQKTKEGIMSLWGKAKAATSSSSSSQPPA